MLKVESLLTLWKQGQSDNQSANKLANSLVDETEAILKSNNADQLPRAWWLDLIDTTRHPDFLQALASEEARNRWAEMVFLVIQNTNYSLLDMIRQRVSSHPGRVMFRDLSSQGFVEWTYEQIYRHIREIAALFCRSSETPRVALYTENCLEGAAVDLACLSHDIFVTPLSPHFKQDILTPIFDQLGITHVVTDSSSHLSVLTSLSDNVIAPFTIYTLQPGVSPGNTIPYLPEACKRFSLKEISETLDKRKPAPINRVITTMFTSGSTGVPKGVSFSVYNIVTKRFARAAALPEVGEETFLCFLPLFHTFGRYLEMTGSIFWGGIYVFAGNTSAETLLSLFPKISPTGFISIPLRWQELYDMCQEQIRMLDDHELRANAVRSVVGENLHWGLSAAGYLDPGVFRFFNQYGIHLCSGFGMTEATGGVTMTPPGNYVEETVGKPLPGVYTRLVADSELELRGHYITRYLEFAGPGDEIPFPLSEADDNWLPTGDVFTVSGDGFYRIVDRVKDIYKNNRGQTVAPQVMEKRFFKVPGIKSCFLAGDHQPYNVLLIVPNKEDQICQSLKGEKLREYYRQIIAAANGDVAPYERVINFAILDHDFSMQKGELTAKGSFNRKKISEHFSKEIDALYTSNFVTIEIPDKVIQIPKWLFRDLGILESDIVFRAGKLIDRRNKRKLTFRQAIDGGFQIGDLKYIIHQEVIDLGVFTRQPGLWIGNPEFISFFPVKEGWDVSVKNMAETIYIARFRCPTGNCIPMLQGVTSQQLIRINLLLSTAIFGDIQEACMAIREVGELFSKMEPRLADVSRHRLEALAFHPEEEIRTLAYRIILLKAPRPEQIPYMPAFIESGLTFLNEESIHEIVTGNFGKHRLDALKKRLYYYRTQLTWPANRKNRKQFSDVLSMLYNFAILNMDFYGPIRAELSRWALFREDPWLAKRAQDLFMKMAGVFEESMSKQTPVYSSEEWKLKVTFESGIPEHAKERMITLFRTTTFLEESMLLTVNEARFNLNDIPEHGIWVLRLLAFKEFNHYRVSINTTSGDHYDLHMVMSENPKFKPNHDLFYWLASLAGFPHGPAVAPILGSNKPDHGALSTQYIGGLTAWEKIRELSEIHQSAGDVVENTWRKIFIKAFAVVFKAWHHSGYQIVPGTISPANVVIPEMDFRETAVILSLTGWGAYTGPLSLIEPMVQDFYCKTIAFYPWSRKQLQIRWIFDACIEALGKAESVEFLETLLTELKEREISCFDNTQLREHLQAYLSETFPKYYLPLSLYCAIDQYSEWTRINPLTTPSAREQTIMELMELYKLNTYPDLVRYSFYRDTYFANKSIEVSAAFNALILRMQENPATLPIQLLELSELQSAIEVPEDKNIFSRMVFPRLQPRQRIDFLKRGEEKSDQMIVQFDMEDKRGRHYILREPIEPREIGQLYQIFFREKYPKEPLENDRQYIVTDRDGKVVGGVTWHFMDEKNVLLDGIVVTSALQSRGLGSAIMGSFFTSMEARGIEVVKAHFLFGNYYMKHFFKVDKSWGALIKQLRIKKY